MLRSAARAAPLVALLLFVAGLSLRPMAESDVFFRIKAGEEILARHALPGLNLYSFTYPDHPDIDTAWLFEVGVAALYARGGFEAIVVAKTVLLMAVFAAAFGLCRRRGAGPAASALVLAAAAYAGQERFVERPHLFSLAGEVALLFALDALAAAGASRKATARAGVGVVLAVALSVALWANLHAGAFVAPALLAFAAVGAALDRAPGAARRLTIAALAAGAATLATPIGTGIFTYLRLHRTLPALHPVDEFRSPTWLSDPALVMFAAVALAIIGLALARARPAWRPGWRVLLAVLPFAALAAVSVRFAADLALVAAPVIAAAATALAVDVRARWPRLSVDHPVPVPVPAVAAAALLAGLALGPRLASRTGWDIGLDTRELPLAAIAFVDGNGLRERMYNDFEIGSYLLFQRDAGYPRHRVFVDPRLPAYPPEFHRLLGRPDVTRAEWAAAMDGYGVETALLAYAGVNHRVAWWDPERYALVFKQADARVFVRRLPRYQAVIARHEIPATFGFSPQEGTATLPLVARPAASPVAECEWQRRLGDVMFDVDGAMSARALAAYTAALSAPAGCLRAEDEARLAAWLGGIALGAGRAQDALQLCERARARGDREVTTMTNRAVALEQLGRARDAVAAWDEVIAHEGGQSPLAARARERRARLLRAEP